MNKTTRELLNFDALDMAEKLTGKSYKTDKETENLGFFLHIKAGKIKNDHLQSIGDTNYWTSWSDFKTLIQKNGFKIILLEPFETTKLDNGPVLQEEFLIARNGGAILKAESYSGKTINMAEVYFNAKLKNPNLSAPENYCFNKCGGHTIYTGDNADDLGYAPDSMSDNEFYSNSVRIGYFDVREGMMSKLSDIEENAEIILPWIEAPSLWFVNRTESRIIRDRNGDNDFINNFSDYDEISNERFFRLGLDKILGVKPGQKYNERKQRTID